MFSLSAVAISIQKYGSISIFIINILWPQEDTVLLCLGVVINMHMYINAYKYLYLCESSRATGYQCCGIDLRF